MPVNFMAATVTRAIGIGGSALLTAILSGCGPGASPARSVVAQDVFLPPDTTSIQGVVLPGATLDSMLRGHGLSADAVHAAVTAARAVFDPRRLRAPQPFVLERTLDGRLRHFEYEIDPDFFLEVEPVEFGSDSLRAEVVPIPKRLEHAVVTGGIDTDTPSLFQAMDAAGESAELTIGLAGIFAGEIDFNNEVQPGDRFALAFERFVRDARPSSYGEITAAEFENDGRRLRAIRFSPANGRPGYFDEQGRSLRRFFLRSPLKFEPRVTSRYSLSRFHPVLRTARPHRGVDYGAPRGAPVVTVASGTVLSATYDNANGRMVRVRHASGYVSYYLHLSAFAPGMRRGARVDQGQMIGRVGATGLATGPHLHYGLQKNGAWVDPLREHRNMPPGDPVPAGDMDAFRAVRDSALRKLEGANL
jgi:murein DD-endopeptidase MepM/ murein hydrolase activator NlpD